MNEEYHKPFIKSLFIIACVTIGAIVTNHYVIAYYSNSFSSQQKTIEYSIQKD